MGGYGVYRTFYETPGRYAGLAVFSGSPDIGRRWIGADQPDFQDTTLLRRFKDMQIFVFHGGRDRNCPVEQTEELVRKLRAAGAVVEYHLEPAKGHESPGPATARAYRRWLRSMAVR